MACYSAFEAQQILSPRISNWRSERQLQPQPQPRPSVIDPIDRHLGSASGVTLLLPLPLLSMSLVVDAWRSSTGTSSKRLCVAAIAHNITFPTRDEPATPISNWRSTRRQTTVTMCRESCMYEVPRYRPIDTPPENNFSHPLQRAYRTALAQR
jgi:hypothetical protein